MKLVCLDTNIVIWGIKKEATPGQEKNITRAVRLIENIHQRGDHVMIPSVAVSEALVLCDPQRRVEIASLISENFFVPPFDMAAATCGAEIQKMKKAHDLGTNRHEQIGKNHYVTCDCMILATAVTRHATKLYTHDGPLLEFARAYLKQKDIHLSIKTLPEGIEEQNSLLKEEEQ